METWKAENLDRSTDKSRQDQTRADRWDVECPYIVFRALKEEGREDPAQPRPNVGAGAEEAEGRMMGGRVVEIHGKSAESKMVR